MERSSSLLKQLYKVFNCLLADNLPKQNKTKKEKQKTKTKLDRSKIVKIFSLAISNEKIKRSVNCN